MMERAMNDKVQGKIKSKRDAGELVGCSEIPVNDGSPAADKSSSLPHFTLWTDETCLTQTSITAGLAMPTAGQKLPPRASRFAHAVALNWVRNHNWEKLCILTNGQFLPSPSAIPLPAARQLGVEAWQPPVRTDGCAIISEFSGRQ